MPERDRKSEKSAAVQASFEWSFFHPRYWLLWLFLILLRVLVFLPLPVLHIMGRAIGRVFYRVNEKRRRIARINIDLCFPELSGEEKDSLVLRHFEAYGANIFDLAICWWAPSPRLDRLTTVHGLERYLALVEQGRSVVLVTGHILTVDLCGQYISRYQAGVSMMKPLKNRLLNWMMYRGRMRNGNLMVTREQGMRPMVRYLRQGYTGYFMPDEDFGSPASVFAPFFGVPAYTMLLVSKLARRTGARVIFMFAERLAPRRGFRIHCIAAPEGIDAEDDLTAAAALNLGVEQCVSVCPEQYLWPYKRFRKRLPGASGRYQGPL